MTSPTRRPKAASRTAKRGQSTEARVSAGQPGSATTKPGRGSAGSRGRRRARRSLRWFWLGIPAPILVVLIAIWVWATRPGTGSGQWVTLDWRPGTSATEGARLMVERGVVSNPMFMAAYLRLYGAVARPEPGLHLVRNDLSPRQLVEYLARLATRPRSSVTFPEGWNHVQVAQRLEQRGICAAVGFRQAVFDAALARQLGVTGDSLDGYLFPDTYELYLNSEPKTVVRTLVHRAKQQLASVVDRHQAAMHSLAREFGWGERELVILASMVEAEAGIPEERPVIASVFLNRLREATFRPRGMLQSDPTAGYGCLIEPDSAPSCADYARKITPAMLRDAANRYNTYRHSGLPPGPIGNPGLAALGAVLEPARTEYLFFVARGGGRHAFSRTFEEHSQRIRQGPFSGTAILDE